MNYSDEKFVETLKELLEEFELNFNETKFKVFENHVRTMMDRLLKNEKLNFELDENLRNQIPSDLLDRSKIFTSKLIEKLNLSEDIFLPEEEIFLLSTHLVN